MEVQHDMDDADDDDQLPAGPGWVAPGWARPGFGRAALRAASDVDLSGRHGHGHGTADMTCSAAPPGPCPLRQWVSASTEDSDGLSTLLFSERQRLIVKGCPVVCGRWAQLQGDGKGRDTSTLTVGIGQRVAPFHPSWVSAVRARLPGIDVAVHDGSLSLCPWLCQDATKAGSCERAGTGPPCVVLPDARLSLPSQFAQEALLVILPLLAHAPAMCHGLVTQECVDRLQLAVVTDAVAAHEATRIPPNSRHRSIGIGMAAAKAPPLWWVAWR